MELDPRLRGDDSGKQNMQNNRKYQDLLIKAAFKSLEKALESEGNVTTTTRHEWRGHNRHVIFMFNDGNPVHPITKSYYYRDDYPTQSDFINDVLTDIGMFILDYACNFPTGCSVVMSYDLLKNEFMGHEGLNTFWNPENFTFDQETFQRFLDTVPEDSSSEDLIVMVGDIGNQKASGSYLRTSYTLREQTRSNKLTKLFSVVKHNFAYYREEAEKNFKKESLMRYLLSFHWMRDFFNWLRGKPCTPPLPESIHKQPMTLKQYSTRRDRQVALRDRQVAACRDRRLGKTSSALVLSLELAKDIMRLSTT